MRRNGGPVQQWVDSIPSPTKSSIDIHVESHESSSSLVPEDHHFKKVSSLKNPIMTLSAPSSPAITMSGIPSRLVRDPSLQSDSSHCSSVESLLELRKPDPEAILLGLGFGGCYNNAQPDGPLSRIPKRFLQPSKLRGIVIDDFVRQQQETNESIDTASLGYRGLTGSPYVAPSEIVQKIMERLREHESHELDLQTSYNNNSNNQNNDSNAESYNSHAMPEVRLSVLSPNNRQFLNRERSRSPDMRNKRMIIGQKSFAFNGDGELIEIIKPDNHQDCVPSDNSTDSKTDIKNSYRSSSITDNKEFICQTHDNKSSEKLKRKIIKQKFIDDTFDSLSGSGLSTIESKSTADDLNSSSNINISVKNSGRNCSLNSRQSRKLTRDNRHQQECDVTSNSFRRASDGSHYFDDKHSSHSSEEGRRFSDGVIKQASDRRRSFRRQARINDVEAASYENEIDVPVDQESIKLPSITISSSERLEPELKSDTCNSERSELCCTSDQSEQLCRHDADSPGCCYHASSTSCWRKMRKIMKKNQKLENMVAKNRQEMAEIRGMLSNVLSVRMEPGF
ncbi:probable serine/threonine-protein kinase DDB_G0283337 isoform X1 [Microplitis demolitor]|uniref:probable serine/threonine-protein kinase DDB_G0283337 isoform X1 n=1 Tax=Microplitis demolitor TaxID=69319 RepID=UPI0004CD1F01|nr:probable serine/threonine-protein kinase DDB_G0283337 isoform X1 [Microplitis demolitor]